ncbi:amidase signature domain-containing protein [Cladorrhinum sp. PSN332]|nr:amidase signature domain-containing protein [Cladorrhinum sp. PSN332]
MGLFAPWSRVRSRFLAWFGASYRISATALSNYATGHTTMMPQIFTGDSGSYLVHPQPLSSVKAAGLNPTQIIPFVVISPKNDRVSRLDITDAVSKFARIDDVFSTDFLTGLVGVAGHRLEPDAINDMQEIDTGRGSCWSVTNIIPVETDIVPGPYFLFGNAIHQAWKLYSDDLDAFSVAVYPTNVKAKGPDAYNFSALNFLDTDGIWKKVAVPSRLYAMSGASGASSPERPLAGVRITVKDNYRLAGVKSTFSSRAYTATYGPDTTTAVLVQQLIDLGAIVIGKSKMSSFASAEEPTDQWVDFHAPFNPRGDGYQTPAGSSNGAAAAVSGYPWADFSFATDTSGSTRYPAAICGLFGLRYTSHTIDTEGVQPCCREFDAIGLLGRDLETFHQVASLTVKGGAGDVKKYPTRILYPTDFLPYTEEPVQAILEEFVKQLESYLGVQREVINIAELWDKYPPPEGKGKTIKEFLNKTGFYPFYYDGYHVNKQFLEDHRNKFDREVYFGPYMRWKMDTGAKVTLERKE